MLIDPPLQKIKSYFSISPLSPSYQLQILIVRRALIQNLLPNLRCECKYFPSRSQERKKKKKSYSMNILTHSDEFVGLKNKLMKVWQEKYTTSISLFNSAFSFPVGVNWYILKEVIISQYPFVTIYLFLKVLISF